MEDNNLNILIEVSLDQVKSLQNILVDLKQLQNKVKTYRLKVLAGLDKTASSAQIKSDLAQITKLKSKVKIVGEVDKSTTRKNVDTAIKNLKNTEIKLTGILDSSATQRNVQQQLGQIPNVETTANVNVNGGDEVDKLRSQMANAGESAAGMASKIYIARSALQLLRRTAIEAKETIIELDSAATDLALATGSNSEEAYELLEQYNALGKRLGATTTQVAEGATEWLRQGKSATETSALIEQSMILSKVGAMTADTATKSLTSTMKGFKLETAEAAGVVDRLTALDLRAAVTSEDLATAVARTASSANLAGVGLDKLLGYITVVEETTQKSAETIGESFKTLFSRLGNIKLGKFFDDDGEDLSDVEKVLNSFGIKLRENKDKFRDFGTVLDEVAAKWSGFTNVEQSAIATTMAGVRQRENFLVLMQNYSKSLEYAEISANSAGTALQKFEAYQDSIEAKSARFAAVIEGLTLDTIDTGFVGDLIDAGTAIIELVEKTDLLKAALVSLGVGATLKGITAISDSFIAAKQNILNMGEAVQTLRKTRDVGALSAETITRLGGLTKGLTDEQLRLVLSTQRLTTAQMTQILTAGGLSKAEAAAKLQTLGFATAEGTATAATFTLSGAMTGLGTAIKAAFASNPIGMTMLAVGAAYELVKGVMAIYDAVTVTAAEATEAMEKSFSEFEEAENRVNSLNDELKTTQDRIDELNTKETLTFVEESELQKLKESVELLQIQADLAEKERIREVKEAAGDTITAYRKNFEHDISADAVQEYMDYSNTSGNNAALFADESNISAMLAGLQQMKRLRDELDKSSEIYKEDYQHFQGIIDDATGSLENQIRVLSTYKANLEAIPYNELTDNQKAALDEINAAIKLIYTTLDPAKWAEIQWGSIVSDEKYSADVKKLNELAAQSKITADTIKSQFPALAQACADAGIAVEDVVGNINASFKSADGDGVSNYTAKLSELSEVLSDLQSSYDLLETAQNDMLDGGGLSPETIEKLAKAEANYLDYLYEENGVVKLNGKAWEKRSNAPMMGEMTEIQKEIDSLKEQNNALKENIAYCEEQRQLGSDGGLWSNLIAQTTADIEDNNKAIEENQAKLAIYSSLYGSITGDLDAYTAALQNFSNIANSIDSITGSFQTLANLQAEVANGFTMSLDKALEFAKVYPEILNSAQATADGQIMLNEGVVNSFIRDKKAELDAQIDAEVAKLEADKEVLQAKIETAQAQLDLAKNVGEGEGQVAKEVAEYRIRASNEMVQALIDNGIDGAEAFKLAAQAMSLNAEEFNRVAKEVCADVDGNFNGAAYNAAMGIYENMERAKADIDSVTKQAHEAAKAVAGIGEGTVRGTVGKKSGSGGATKRKRIDTEVTSGEFNGFDFDFDFKKVSLDDFISQVELDISSYQNAISQIDGQIAALQALKNAPLKNFKSPSGSKKEVEEYIATIDEYREAVERLRKAQEEADKLETAIDNAGSFEKKIELQKKLIAAYREEQDALRNLNNQRDTTIIEGAQSLRKLGFEVQYDADTDNLWISNMEHLNELTADSKGKYDTLQEATNALRQDTEKLIGTIADLNDSNRDGSETWLELASSIHEANIAIYENMVKASEHEIALSSNWLDNAVASGNVEGIQKYTSSIVEQYKKMQDAIHAEAEYYRSKDYSDTSDEVSKLSDLWWDYEQKIKDTTISAYEAVRSAIENQVVLTETHLEQAMNRGDLDSVSRYTDDVVAMYRKMQENVHQQADYYRSEGLAETSDEIRQLSSLWWDYEQDIVDAKKTAHEAVISDIDNKLKLIDNWMNNAVASGNLSDIKRRADEVVALNKAKQEELHAQAEYYRLLGDNDASSRVSDLSDRWYDCADAIKAAKQQVVDYLISVVDAASDSVDEIRSVTDTLYAAADEFTANDGFITIDTWNALRKMGTQYMQLLKNENNEWEINEERINDVIAASTRQLAVENAMSYVERLKLATQEGSIENLNDLIFVTTDATNSTWGLVYAELELMHTMGDLNDSQYQAALHNIQAMHDLAENAVANIGKVTGAATKNLEETKDNLRDLLDELEDMKDGSDDLVGYVMDMLKHRIQQQINLLEEMKDKYSEIIDLKKKSLDATKNEQDYQKSIAKKLKEMAKLQERINALSLDDSRSAKAEKARLLEELAELQEDLDDTQAGKSIEAQKEALDQMEEDYHAEKDKEIEILENSISSYQKLYDMAIDYIRNNWDTLYAELISWNTEYGNDLNSSITEAWEAAQAAAQRYGDFVSAIMGDISTEIDNITQQIEALEERMGNLSTGTNSGGTGTSSKNTTVGKTSNSYSNDEIIHAIIKEMFQNSQMWHTVSASEQQQLDQRNQELGVRLNGLGVNARRDNGVWYDGNELLFEKYKQYIYHTGGFVGDEPLKPNERYIKAENGELVLTSDQQDSFAAQIDRIGAMAEKFMSTPLAMAQPISSDFSHLGNSTINNVTNTSNNQPMEIHLGDVIIQGNASIETVKQHQKVTYDMVDEIARILQFRI